MQDTKWQEIYNKEYIGLLKVSYYGALQTVI